MEAMQTAVRDAIRHELEEAGVYPDAQVVDSCAEAAVEAAVPYIDLIVNLNETPREQR